MHNEQVDVWGDMTLFIGFRLSRNNSLSFVSFFPSKFSSRKAQIDRQNGRRTYQEKKPSPQHLQTDVSSPLNVCQLPWPGVRESEHTYTMTCHLNNLTPLHPTRDTSTFARLFTNLFVKALFKKSYQRLQLPPGVCQSNNIHTNTQHLAEPIHIGIGFFYHFRKNGSKKSETIGQ